MHKRDISVDIPREVPSLKPLGTPTFRLRPRIAVHERTEVHVVPDRNDQQGSSYLQAHSGTEGRRDKVKDTTRQQNGEVQRREVVMQEKLAIHEIERQIVQCPANEQEAA